MTTAQETTQPLEVMGGQSLKAALAKAERKNKIRAFLLVLPLLVFIILTFLAPIARMMFFSFDNPVIINLFPNTIAALQDWDPTGAPTPPENVYKTFAAEMSRASKDRTIGKAATRLNYDKGGMRSLMTKTGRKISRTQAGPFMEGKWKETFIGISKKWGDRDVWGDHQGRR